MLERILSFSIKQRWLIMAFTLLAAAAGVYSFRFLTIDAVPDITNVQVQINSEAPGYTPLETEQLVTFPLETAIAGIPRLVETRSLSRYGLSQVTAVFEDGTDIYFARQQIAERLAQVKGSLPPGIDSAMGPISTGLGEIFMWTVGTQEGAKKPDGTPYSPADLRTLQDWVIKPQLRNIPGVNEINSLGGYERQFQVSPHPQRLLQYGLSFDDLVSALLKNNGNAGAGYIERSGEQYLVRVPGQISTLEEIRNVVVKTREGHPVRVADIAQVSEGHDLRNGAATQDGEEVVLGTAFLLKGENSRTVSQRVGQRIESVERSLPQGVVITPVYSRTTLVDQTIATVRNNLIEGAILVIVILFLFLGNVRAAIITAMVIPLSMLLTISGMAANNLSANLMSLGAIDFGLIVDGAVIIVENCVRRLALAQKKAGGALSLKERLEVIFDASREVRKATMFGEAIIMVVYLPILTLTGIEGKMFRPMALSVIFALTGAMVLSVTAVPAAVAIFLRGRIHEGKLGIERAAERAYLPLLRRALALKPMVVALALVLVAISGLVAYRMGSEFIPQLDEGDMAIHALRIPGTSLSQAIELQHQVDTAIRAFPEVKTVFAKIGTAEIATDPMPPSVADTMVMMKPRIEWPDPDRPKEDLVQAIEKTLRELPGNNYEFTQPIEMRFNELIAGVRADVAVKVFGDDLETMQEIGEEIEAVLQGVPGAADVKLEQTTGLPMLAVKPKRDMMARYGISLAELQEVVRIGVGGIEAGEVMQGDRRFPIVVRLDETRRNDPQEIRRLPVFLESGFEQADHLGGSTPRYVPLEAVADIQLHQGPNQISREEGKRRVVVTANVRGRDLGTFVAEAEKRVAEQVELPPGLWIAWGGQFEHLISATDRLMLVVPLSLALIFALLYVSLRKVGDAILVFTAVPFALTGGVFALWIRGIPLSISAGVGFIALSGVAVLNGLVLVTFLQRRMRDSVAIRQAIEEAAVTRLRPVLMTALVASLGFVPMALASGTGAEVQRPLATVVIGGILSSTTLTLIVLPVLYEWAHKGLRWNQGSSIQ